jgi:hypothetical protein
MDTGRAEPCTLPGFHSTRRATADSTALKAGMPGRYPRRSINDRKYDKQQLNFCAVCAGVPEGTIAPM